MSTAVAAVDRPAPTRDNTVTGTGLLAVAFLRRSRWFWLAWLLCLVSVFPASAGAYRQTVPEGAAGVEMARTLGGNLTMRAILGPPYDLLHVGPFVMWRVGTFMITVAGIMAILGVLRGTRAEEEDGRLELLRAGAIGRHAPLAATLLVCLGACLALGVLTTASMVGPSGDLAGSTAMGLGAALGAGVWVGVAAVAAQVSESARAARGLSLGLLGAAYGLRVVADGNEPAIALLQWISPVEWPALARPYAGERWLVLLLPLALTVLLVAAAFALEARRDHGAGLWAARLGPATGREGLRGAVSLALRLDRGSIQWWALGLGVFALGMGTLATSLQDMLRQTPDLQERFRRMGGGASDLTDAFYVAMIGILVPLVAMLSLQLLGTLRREEERGHAELMLSTGTSRTRQILAHLLPAVTAPAVVLVVVGAAMALPRVGDDPGLVATLTGAASSQLPGILVVTGFAVAVHGWAPRWGVLPWVVVGWSLTMSWLGEILGLPSSLISTTPWAHLGRPPAEPFEVVPFAVETVLGVTLMAFGVVGYRRRDIASG